MIRITRRNYAGVETQVIADQKLLGTTGGDGSEGAVFFVTLRAESDAPGSIVTQTPFLGTLQLEAI